MSNINKRTFKINGNVIGTCRRAEVVPLIELEDKTVLPEDKDGTYDLDVLTILPTDLIQFFGFELLEDSSMLLTQFITIIKKQLKEADYDVDKGLFIVSTNSIDTIVLAHFPDILNEKYEFNAKKYVNAQVARKFDGIEGFPTFVCSLGNEIPFEAGINQLMVGTDELTLITTPVHLNPNFDLNLVQVQQLMDDHKNGLYDDLNLNHNI